MVILGWVVIFIAVLGYVVLLEILRRMLFSGVDLIYKDE